MVAARVAFFAIALTLTFLGARDIVRNQVLPRTPAPATTNSSAIDQAGEAFAVRFTKAYLSYSAGKPDDYLGRIAPYLGAGVDASSLWDGSGTETVTSVLPVVEQRTAIGEIVTVAADVGGNRWEYVAVPLESDGGAYAVVARPALVPPPATDPRSVQTSYQQRDYELEAALRPNLQAFFQAYAGGGQTQLSYYAAPGLALTGLSGVSFDALTDLQVSQGGDQHRTVLADVRWRDEQSGGALVQSYALTIEQIDGKWLVAGVGPVAGGQ